MGNVQHGNHRARRETDNSSKLLKNDGEDLEKNSGLAKTQECEISTLDVGGIISTETPQERNKANTKGEDKKGGKSSSKVVIENQTDKVMVLREKIRVANGLVRYSIEAGSSIVIKVGPQSTYYRLLVYAVEVKDSSTEDTGLTIDSDMLSDATHIVLYKDKDGKYVFR